MRRFIRVAQALGLVTVAYLAVAVLGGFLGASGGRDPGDRTVTVGLLRGPIHYDFLLPADPDTRAAFALAAEAGVPVFAPGAEWVLVGWGARDFYTTIGTYRDVSLRAILTGVFGDHAVLRIDAFGPLPKAAPGLRWFHLTEGEYARLRDAIAGEMAGAEVLDHAGFTTTDAFLAVPGRFHLFRTCNVWVGERFRLAGLPFGWWTPAPYSVTLSLRSFGWTAG